MKLRQKLAMVLAAAMVVTAVPVTTMAASKNDVTKVLTVQKDKNVGWEIVKDEAGNLKDVTTSSAVELKIDPVDGLKAGDEFYLQLDNAQWAGKNEFNHVFAEVEAQYPGLSFERVNDKEVKVTVNKAVDTMFKIPMLATATGGEATVTVVEEQTTLTGGKFVFAVTPEAEIQGTVEIGSTKSFYTTGKLAGIKITEVAPGAFAGLQEQNRFVKVTLGHGDFDFKHNGGTAEEITVGTEKVKVYKTTVTQTGSRGLAGISENAVAYVDKNDTQVMYVQLPNTASNSRGAVEFTNIEVVANTRKPETGDLTVDIEGKAIANQTGLTVAKIAEYGVELSIEDDKAVEIIAGRSGKVTFTLSEVVEDSMSEGSARTVEFTLDKGHFGHATTKVGTDNKEVTIKPELTVGKIKHGDQDVTEQVMETIHYVYDKDNNLVGFELKLDATENVDKFTFEDVVVHAPITEEGVVTLKIAGRAIDEELEKEIVNIKTPATLKAEAMKVKVGLKDQKGGLVTITETEAGMFAKGKTLEFVIDSEGDFEFTGAPTVEVKEGDMQLGEVTLSKDGKLTVEVKRASKEASTIEIAGFEVKVDRTVPEGAYDMEVAGSALTSCGSITVEDFFVVGTPNTEDNATNNGLNKGVGIFKVGNKTYTVNGEEKEMDAAPYISKSNRVMVPVRYVSDVFGVNGKDVLFSKENGGTITIFAGNRVLQVVNGSNIALMNGIRIPMDEKVTIVDGRTYVPVGEMARLLNVDVEWSNETKTATFTNR